MVVLAVVIVILIVTRITLAGDLGGALSGRLTQLHQRPMGGADDVGDLDPMHQPGAEAHRPGQQGHEQERGAGVAGAGHPLFIDASRVNRQTN